MSELLRQLLESALAALGGGPMSEDLGDRLARITNPIILPIRVLPAR